MFMSRHLPLFAALGFAMLPLGPAPKPAQPARVVAQRDLAFVVPDTVAALLSYVTCLAVDDDGTLYLADYHLSAVLKLDPRGNLLGTLGRRGSGPGEFYSVFSLGLRGDSLWTMDPGLNRVTFFPRRGRGVTTIPFGPAAPTGMEGNKERVRGGLPVAVLPGGELLFEEAVRDSSDPAGGYTHGLLLRASRNLEVADTVARYPMTHSALAFVYRNGEAHYTQPFGDDPLFAVSRDGRLLVTVSRPAVKRGETGQFTVTAWQDGKVKLFSRQVAYAPRRLPRRVVDSVAEVLSGAGGRDAPRNPITADSIRRRLYRPAYYPPVRDVKVARDGTIWLQVAFAEVSDEGAEWLQLSSHGFELGRTVLPPGFRLLEAERRDLWGFELNEDNVPVLTKYVVSGRVAAL